MHSAKKLMALGKEIFVECFFFVESFLWLLAKAFR
jgi:hypothetical protein